MGKGDRKTRKGKIFAHTYGKSRRRKLPKQKKSLFQKQIIEMEKLKVDQISRLYMLREVFENMIKHKEDYIQEGNDDEEFIKNQNHQIQLIDDAIDKLRGTDFQFSIEELFSMVGQYDKFVGIDFHLNSESTKKFGNNIMGVLIYNRREREDLNKVLNSDNITRTNGYVRIKPSELTKLSAEQRDELIKTGFLSGDVFEINHTGIYYHESFIDKDTKAIPGTVNIEFDPTGLNPELMSLYLLERRITEAIKPLIKSEWDDYFALKILYKISEITETQWKENIYEANSKIIKEGIRYKVYESKLFRGIKLMDRNQEIY